MIYFLVIAVFVLLWRLMNNKYRIDTKKDLATMGSSLTIAGVGCSSLALISLVGIPFLIVTAPIALLGIILLISIPFAKTKKLVCPKCGTTLQALINKKAIKCSECEEIVVAADPSS